MSSVVGVDEAIAVEIGAATLLRASFARPSLVSREELSEKWTRRHPCRPEFDRCSER
jgi:hypothetical protein